MAAMEDDARHLRQIAQRLSLRAPQERSLEILAGIVERIDLSKDLDPAEALASVQSAYPNVTEFPHAFPSLCFALATGVGKTRLMGASIAFLYLTGRSRNFFVLAPNTTIYDKLVADFSQQTSPKYVFRGISQFAQSPPHIITGENWEHAAAGLDLFGRQGAAVINIFNVDKINKDKGRIRTLRETIGESYFDYLAGLPDLVLLMDEAHRYRASAGMKAIAELRPILGLEFTATPRSVGARSTPFKNVVFDYRLGDAMRDGFVKEPAVATRANFQRKGLEDDELETIMLEDAIHYHEHVRAELDLYARQTGRPRVHPFVLVVAQDTGHASRIRQRIESEDFFGGAYRDLVAEVHSNLKGEESDDATSRLVGLETDARTEIVVHVNKLKEGWDVTNLYTIVPLRASASDILTEQTLGRGLRLPYGTRTGVEAVDTLTVIAHDRFEEVVKQARADGSIVKVKEITIGNGGDVPDTASRIVELRPDFDTILTGRPSGVSDVATQAPFAFSTPEARRTAEVAVDVIAKKYERELRGLADLKTPEVQQRIAEDVRRILRSDEPTLEGVAPAAGSDADEIVAIVTTSLAENLIEIPEIVVIPSREVNFWFEDFDLTGLDAIRYQPVSDTILIQTLRDESRRELALAAGGPAEERVENYIVRHLIDRAQVDYDSQADMLYKLASQVVSHLRSYLEDDDIENVALRHGKALADFIFAQMQDHYRESPADYQVRVVRAFRTLGPVAVSWTSNTRDLRSPAPRLSETVRYIFTGTKKSPYSFHRFQADPERRLAVLLEGDSTVRKWLKPGRGQFSIEYAAGNTYEPDFVVELDDEKLIVEVKAANEMDDPVVLQKARAAGTWVRQANEAGVRGDKPWSYVLVPDSALTEAATLSGVVGNYRRA